jgi:hypothetical protein
MVDVVPNEPVIGSKTGDDSAVEHVKPFHQ